VSIYLYILVEKRNWRQRKWIRHWSVFGTIFHKHFSTTWLDKCVAVAKQAMVTNQHFTMSDSHVLLAQHVVEHCPAEMWRCWPELGWTEWHKAEQLRNRFQTSSLTARSIPGLRPISSRTVRNRLREHNIRTRRPAIRPICCLDTVQLGWRGVDVI
jgi:hypothetical protein